MGTFLLFINIILDPSMCVHQPYRIRQYNYFVSISAIGSQAQCPVAQGYFADPLLNTCQTYIWCNNFEPLRMACPLGFLFNTDTQNCLSRSEYTCNINQASATTNGFQVEPSTSDTTEDEANLKISSQYCGHLEVILKKALQSLLRSIVNANGMCDNNCLQPNLTLTCS